MLPTAGKPSPPDIPIMEERYEIRKKLGQGGIGSVYHAHDTKLNREVAIKRILSGSDDEKITAESTRQLIAEAEALAALQHPNIITILDVGNDEHGPYVVMELLNGQTLDQIIEQAPLTWEDFREVATQCLEALIAAQELNMIHSDLKPSNIMLTWLASGNFQVKILDFGLAMLIRNQSQEEISKLESVYGSILFMPPEQFERQALDERSDIYSLGCCFYQALTGLYPFHGETSDEVRKAHLEHKVIHVEKIRAEIPVWACNWVMWMIKRDRNERPPTAREALIRFLKNERQVDPEMSLGSASTPRPKLVIAATGMAPPPGVAGAPAAATHTSSPNPAPSRLALRIAAAFAILFLLTGTAWWLKTRYEEAHAQKTYNQMISMAAHPDAMEVSISGDQLRLVLDVLGKTNPKGDLKPICRALAKASANDQTPVDTTIVEFATRQDLHPLIRQSLFEDVISLRNSPETLPTLLDFAAHARDPEQAILALNATNSMLEDQHAKQLLGILSSTPHSEIRKSIEALMDELISFSNERDAIADLLIALNGQTMDPEATAVIQRLLMQCNANKQPPVLDPPSAPDAKHTGPPPNLEPWLKQLQSNEESRQLEAIEALARHTDTAAHAALIDFAGSPDHAKLKIPAIEALVRMNAQAAILGNEGAARQRFKQISWKTKSYEERKLLIEVLGNVKALWAIGILNDLNRSADPKTKELIQEALKKGDHATGNKP